MTTVSDRKKREHIVDHLLYCFQIEDLIRAAQFQPQLLKEWACKQAETEGTDADLEERWLLNMAQSLRDANALEHGHCSDVQETLMELAHLHELLLGVMADESYKSAFSEAEPFLKELAKKSDKQVHPVEQLVIGLYGWLLLRMKKEQISAETEAAMVGLRNWANSLAKGHLRVYFGA